MPIATTDDPQELSDDSSTMGGESSCDLDWLKKPSYTKDDDLSTSDSDSDEDEEDEEEDDDYEPDV